MTRSFGGGPDRQSQSQDQQQQAGFDWQAKLDSFNRYSSDEIAVQAVRVDFGKRLVALIIDFFAAWVAANIFTFIPFIGSLIAQHTALVTVFILLVRDYFFEGRGIGKNLMGLQVVDVRTGAHCSLVQSIKRNLIVLGPLVVLNVVFAVLGIANVALHGIAQVPNISEATMNVLSGIAGVYTFLAIPYESYMVYNRQDGRRFGDQFAGTAIVEAPMDFSKPIPRQ